MCSCDINSWWASERTQLGASWSTGWSLLVCQWPGIHDTVVPMISRAAWPNTHRHIAVTSDERLKSSAIRLCVQQFVQFDINENIRAHWLYVCRILRWPVDSSKAQKRGKRFHYMTSSCKRVELTIVQWMVGIDLAIQICYHKKITAFMAWPSTYVSKTSQCNKAKVNIHISAHKNT